MTRGDLGPTVSSFSGLGRAALVALQAQQLVVIDRRRSKTSVVMNELGPGIADELPDILRSAAVELAKDKVLVTPWGSGSAIVSSPAVTETDESIGELHVLYTGGPPPAEERLLPLVRAFGRHIGLALERDDLHRKTVQIAATLDGMATLDELVTAPDAISEITPRVTAAIGPLIGVTMVGITMWNEDTSTLHSLPGAFGASVADVDSMRGTAKDLRSITARVLTTSLPYMSNHAEGDPGILQDYVRLVGLKKILSLPLQVGDRCIGVLHLANKQTDFTSDDIELATRLTPRIATVLELSTVIRTLALRQQYEAALAEAAFALASGTTFDQAVLPTLERFGVLAEASVVALVGKSRYPLLWRNEDPATELDDRFFADARAAVSGAVGSAPAGAGDTGWAAMHIPLDLHGRRSATLSALRRRAQPFSTYEKTVLRRLASLSTLASATETVREQQADLARLHERQRIADDLHDRVAQVLFAAVLGLDSLLEEPAISSAERVRLTEVRELLIKGDAFIRDTISQLSPSAVHLDQRLRLMVVDVTDDFDLPVELRLETPGPLTFADIPTDVTDAAVRIAREAAVNAAKHARSSHVEVTVELDAEGVQVDVLDDGVGLPPAPNADTSYGMPSMLRTAHSAGGTVEFLTGPDNRGTLVRARFPLAPP